MITTEKKGVIALREPLLGAGIFKTFFTVLFFEMPTGHNQFLIIAADVRWCYLYFYEPELSAIA